MNANPNTKERLSVESILRTAVAGSAGPLLRPWAKWMLAAAAAIVLVAVYWLASGSSSAVRYVTADARRGGLTVIVTATGSVQPTKKVDVSSELSGTVRKVLVDYNSPVKAGQTLGSASV